MAAAGDPVPTPASGRTLRFPSFLALWAGMAMAVPSFYAAFSLVDLGMSAPQSLAAIALGYLLLLAPLALSGALGARHGLPFPPLLVPAFGRRGAAVPCLARLAVALGWCAIESWILARAAVVLLLPAAARSSPAMAPLPALGTSPLDLACFILATVAQWAILLKGMPAVHALSSYATPVLAVLTAWLFCWVCIKTGGFGPPMSAPSRLSPPELWPVFAASVSAVMGGWSSMVISVSDFTRFASSEADQALGLLGLPAASALFSLAGLVVVSSSQSLFGRVIADPVDFLGEIDCSAAVKAVAFVGIALAVVTTNIPANFVAPINVLVRLCPSAFSFSTAAAATATASILFQPWRLIGSSESFIYAWLNGCAVLLGPMAGVFLVDSFILRRGAALDVNELLTPTSEDPYSYAGGFNPPAFAALGLSTALVASTFLMKQTAAGSGPVAAVLSVLYGSAWLVGFTSAGVIYWGICSCRRKCCAKPSELQSAPAAALAQPLRLPARI